MTVYFARATALGHIKIGYVRDVRGCSVHDRLQQVGRLVGSPMELLATTRGKRRVERFYHLRHAANEIGGEWFRPSPDLDADIEWARSGRAHPDLPPAPPYAHYRHYKGWHDVTRPGDAAKRWTSWPVNLGQLKRAVDRVARAA